ncbi:MAG: 3-dehydroquinate synthase [Thermodesulfovibrio sp.]|nr:3-dehydroquinate synthase [Thermodesulfovibrio sp.]
MQKVSVKLGKRSYEVVIGRQSLSDIGERIRTFVFSPRIAIISNPTVFNLYGDDIMVSLKKAGFGCSHVLIPDGEEYKDHLWAYYILTELLKNRLDRNSCIIALGGGVIGDITGFVASIYMRGIHFIQIPTTLLSQVDSSVGGKTGVNHYLGKNMIGTFYQPRLVWIDIDTLTTLPQRELLSGIAEIIKYGVIRDEKLFNFMEQKRDNILGLDFESLEFIIKRSCEIKSEVVSQDERESGLRAILNYGHTIGHAVETETAYSRFLHGEAVAMGMHFEARLSTIIGLINRDGLLRIKSLIDAYHLPSDLPRDLNADKLISHMRLDKKAVTGEIKFTLPERIGKAVLRGDINVKDIKKAIT